MGLRFQTGYNTKPFHYCGVKHNSELIGDNYGNKFLHLVNSNDCSDSICLGFDRKMGKEKRYETTIPQKLIHCFKALRNGGVVLKKFHQTLIISLTPVCYC